MAPTTTRSRPSSARFASLGTGDVLDQPTAAVALAEPSIQLLRAMIATYLADRSLAQAPRDASLALRVQQFIRTHLHERGLTAARITAAHQISVRHLYATMAPAGVSLHDSIQARRFEECRRDLRDPKRAHLAVATIGARWGFVDPSHFGRAFKNRYGLTPTSSERPVSTAMPTIRALTIIEVVGSCPRSRGPHLRWRFTDRRRNRMRTHLQIYP